MRVHDTADKQRIRQLHHHRIKRLSNGANGLFVNTIDKKLIIGVLIQIGAAAGNVICAKG